MSPSTRAFVSWIRRLAPRIVLLASITVPACAARSAPQASGLRLVRIARGLDKPVHIASIPGDSRLFIVEQTGRIRMYVTVLMIAVDFCDASSDSRSDRAASSSAPRIRVPIFGPSRTSAGLLPKNVGAAATSAPLTTVKCSETWCPSTRQPHVSCVEGVPKIEKK